MYPKIPSPLPSLFVWHAMRKGPIFSCGIIAASVYIPMPIHAVALHSLVPMFINPHTPYQVLLAVPASTRSPQHTVSPSLLFVSCKLNPSKTRREKQEAYDADGGACAAVRHGGHEDGHAQARRDLQAAGARSAPAIPSPEAADGHRGAGSTPVGATLPSGAEAQAAPPSAGAEPAAPCRRRRVHRRLRGHRPPSDATVQGKRGRAGADAGRRRRQPRRQPEPEEAAGERNALRYGLLWQKKPADALFVDRLRRRTPADAPPPPEGDGV